MCASLLDDCLHYGANLGAFVVMPHHIHFLARLPESMNVSQLVERIKSNAAKRVLPHIGPEFRGLRQQTGLNRRSFWQRSFRSIAITHPDAFWIKVRYIHDNPVRAGLTTSAESYPFGSRKFWADLWDESRGLVFTRELVAAFAPLDLVDIFAKPPP